MRIGPLSLCAWNRGFWVRVFGYGLHVKLRKGHQPLFSERMGIRKPLYVGPFRLEWLTKSAA